MYPSLKVIAFTFKKSWSARMARSSTTAKSEVSLFLQYVEMAGEDVMKSRV
jgi:hypothetical protein